MGMQSLLKFCNAVNRKERLIRKMEYNYINNSEWYRKNNKAQTM